MLEDHLLSCHTKCPNSSFTIGGDFNARIAANWEVLIKSKWWAPICLDNFDAERAKMRISKDIRANKAGATFYQMVIRLNLVLLNGSYPPDIPALKVYKAKVVSTFSYAAPFWAAMSNLTPLETLQNQFLHRLLKLPPSVSNASIRLELQIPSLVTTIWKRVFNYWLAAWHRLPDHYLFQCLWRDEYTNPWSSKIHAKLLSIGISPSESLKIDLATAKRLIGQRMNDIELQINHSLGGGTTDQEIDKSREIGTLAISDLDQVSGRYTDYPQLQRPNVSPNVLLLPEEESR
ncbi:hypothetical protein JRQ81_005859 [Phrynocephalus forsythii]|uniref:Uncharacterized protein n=1 Tax=Phrynocephalus forsythii TaxID=171643 RepID=A0A9Q0Y410_9SAUR|nr:hypothetical protein JRQ81_005859 [Phrynocephalus forsythii]